MTWEELVKRAKELGYELDNEGTIKKLYNLGKVFVFTKEGNIIEGGQCISQHRTPDQMYNIIQGLDDLGERVKVGQIYFNEKMGEILVITYTDKMSCYWVTSEGRTCYDRKAYVEKCYVLLAEYPTWEEAINSKEFKK